MKFLFAILIFATLIAFTPVATRAQTLINKPTSTWLMTTKSLGRPPLQVNVGQRFGRLIVLEEVTKSNWGRRRFRCRCDCGSVAVFNFGHLRRVNGTKSCGCISVQIATTHGLSKTPEHYVWKSMLEWCRNPNRKDFRNYGGRGITVCDEWLKFENFFADMGKRPTPKHTIERKNNNAGYWKSNCEWATRLVQNRNRRYNRLSLADAREIRKLHKQGFDGYSIARQFAASRSAIGLVIKNKTWREG